ncbi:MAG: hypothetical protein MI685_08110, partial [Chlorobiales bacterium]|nr:hypothetical protein [Chlorobiales bacterium]
FGYLWNLSWLPELFHSMPYAFALGWAINQLYDDFWITNISMLIGLMVSYAGMQSATWMFLKWETHDDANFDRTSTLKPVIDKLASIFGCKLGDEKYAWIACGVKGFITTLPVGGVFGAILFPLGDEIGTHIEKRATKADPFIFREFLRSALGSISILIFVMIFNFAKGE